MAMVAGCSWCRTFGLAPCLGETFWFVRPYDREGRGFVPRPPRGCGVLYLLSLLLGLDHRTREPRRNRIPSGARGRDVLDSDRVILAGGEPLGGQVVDVLAVDLSHEAGGVGRRDRLDNYGCTPVLDVAWVEDAVEDPDLELLTADKAAVAVEKRQLDRDHVSSLDDVAHPQARSRVVLERRLELCVGAARGRDSEVRAGVRRDVVVAVVSVVHGALVDRVRSRVLAGEAAETAADGGAVGGLARDLVGQRRIGLTLNLALGISCHRYVGLADGEGLIIAAGVVVGRLRVGGAGRDRTGVDVVGVADRQRLVEVVGTTDAGRARRVCRASVGERTFLAGHRGCGVGLADHEALLGTGGREVVRALGDCCLQRAGAGADEIDHARVDSAVRRSQRTDRRLSVTNLGVGRREATAEDGLALTGDVVDAYRARGLLECLERPGLVRR